MGITENPISIQIQKEFTSSLSSKLSTQNARDWKLAIPEIKSADRQGGGNNVQKDLQQVLDLISPTKSPVRRDLEEGISVILIIGDFDLQGLILTNTLLGEGTTKVKMAIHQKTNRKVAVKIIQKQALDKVAVHNLLRELLVLGGLVHDHIVPLLQVVDSENEVYMVMEMETGGELFSYILQKGKIPEPEAVYIFRQIVSAVDYFHKQDIVHRDLKPENVIMDGHGNVKIADFGFASLIRPDSRFEEFCGSPEYASPEMIARKSYIGPEVDIWSLGVILYVMVTGRMPFGANNVSVLFRSIMTGSYPMPQAISQSLSSLIQSILVVQVSKRAKLTDIRDHPWMSCNGTLPPLEFVKADTKPKPEQLSKDILDRLYEFGFTKSQIDEYVNLGVPGPVKTAVYLLKESSNPRTLPFLPDPESLKSPKTQIFDTLSYPLKSTTAQSNLLDKIKLFQESQSPTTLAQTQELPRTQGPPITTTFIHLGNRQDTHLEILSKILLEGGSIPKFEEEEHDVLYAKAVMHKVPLGDFWDTSDPEVMACFMESTETFMIDITVTTQPVGNKFNTVIELVSKQVPEWVIEEFDGFCLDLMKYVI